MGPALLGWIHETELLATFSQIGVLLLMFLAGRNSMENSYASLFVVFCRFLNVAKASFGNIFYFDKQKSTLIKLE